jgi:hypothetical protein
MIGAAWALGVGALLQIMGYCVVFWHLGRHRPA